MGKLLEAAKREIEVLRRARKGIPDIDFYFYGLYDQEPKPGPGVRRLRLPGKDAFGQRPNCKVERDVSVLGSTPPCHGGRTGSIPVRLARWSHGVQVVHTWLSTRRSGIVPP